jgi:cysteine desulfurase
MGRAARLARERLSDAMAHLMAMRDALHRRLRDAIPGLQLNGHEQHRLPNTLHVSFPKITGRDLVARVSPVMAASVGSACHADHDAVSGVLAAMGFDGHRAKGAVRLSVGITTTMDDIETAADSLITQWNRLRQEAISITGAPRA